MNIYGISFKLPSSFQPHAFAKSNNSCDDKQLSEGFSYQQRINLFTFLDCYKQEINKKSCLTKRETANQFRLFLMRKQCPRPTTMNVERFHRPYAVCMLCAFHFLDTQMTCVPWANQVWNHKIANAFCQFDDTLNKIQDSFKWRILLSMLQYSKQMCGFGFDIGVLFPNENSTIFTH